MTHRATPTELSLSHAAKLTGKSKSTINRAVKTGKLSATRHEDGTYSIAASELFRVFDATSQRTASGTDLNLETEPLDPLQLRLQILEAERHREREQMQATIDDLRKRLDRSEDRITALLAAPDKARSSRWYFWKKN